MPDKNGLLTEDDVRHILNWLDKVGATDNTCSICKTDDWTIAQHLVELRSLLTFFGTGQTIYPQVQLICQKCGHTKLINAAFIGILPAPATPDQPVSDGKGVGQ